jgi:sugar phosphate isomerase/epimerase
MIITLHGLSTMYSNAATDIRLAGEVGFDGYEIVEMKLLRYLDQGYKAEDLKPLFAQYHVKPVCINALKSVERVKPEKKAQLLKEAVRLCEAAQILGFPVVQLVPFTGLQGRSWKEVLKLTAQNIAEIADIGKSYHVKFQLEPIAWSPIHSLSQSLEVLATAGKDNVGMVIDFWHLWAGGNTHPEEVAKLDVNLIYGIHFCDGVKHPGPAGSAWNEPALRSYLPGEGNIPIADWVAAVKSTGYQGSWSSELLSPKHWEWDLRTVAIETKRLMEKYIL